MEHLYDTVAKVYRMQTTLEQFNRPKQALTLIGEYKCRVVRKGMTVTQGNPQAYGVLQTKLFTFPNADIKPQDVIEVGGGKYQASIPFVFRTHMEVDLTLREEV